MALNRSGAARGPADPAARPRDSGARPAPAICHRSHSAGEVFQPHQSGTSVAFAGILGGLAAYALFGCAPVLQDWRTRAAVAIPLAVLNTVFRDIHGVAFLAGLLATSAWLLRDRTWEKDTAVCQPAGPPVSSATPNGR